MSAQVPGPRGLPVLGSIPAMIAAGGLMQYFEGLWKVYGDAFRVRIGRRDLWSFAHPDHAEHILKRARRNYIKGESFDQMRLLVGDGLLTDDSDDWLRRRRLAAPAFHGRSLARLVARMDRAVQRSLVRLRRRCASGEVIDIHPEMTRLTLEIVSDALFGVGIAERADASGAAFADALHRIGRRGNAPVALPLAIPTPGNLRLRRSLGFVDAIVHEVIDDAERQARDGADAPTLLGMLLAARGEDGGPGLTRKELRDEVMTMYLAGHETTALSMSWACQLLGQRPEIRTRLREEAEGLADETPSFEAVSGLGYARMVIDEILRLRPPVYGTGRTAVEADHIAGFEIPAGTMVVPNFYLIHRHPEFWDAPERFDPERFAPGRGEDRHPFAYLPFGGGPRICIGQGFARIESQLILARLAQALDIEAVGEVGVNAVATLRPAGPVRVRLRWIDS